LAARNSKSGRAILAPLMVIMLSALCLAACARAKPDPASAATPGDASILGSYLAQVSDRLQQQRFLIKPYYGQATETLVEIGILIDRRCIALNYGLRASSGSDEIDRTILTMIARASPFPPPPSELLQSDQVGIRIAMQLPKTRKEWGDAFN
jgi:hypothetical protein